MTEEVLRRLCNCSAESTWEERSKHLKEFALSLKSSGHNEKFRVTVFRKAVARFEKELTNHNEGVADIYRSREERNKQTEARGGKSSKDTWFRQKSDNGETVASVVRVPFMPDNKLKKRAEEVLKNHKSPAGLHTKVQEGGGSKLEHSLMRSDPFPRQRCQRADCPVGTEDEGCKDACFQNHVNYTIMCVRCENSRREWKEQATHPNDNAVSNSEADNSPPPRCIYCGEYSRGCYVRFGQHIAKYKQRKNFMWRHVEEYHGGVMGPDPHKDFFMKLEAIDVDPIRRILRESVRICQCRDEASKEKSKDDNVVLMNGKDEFFGVKLVQPNFIQE